MEIVNSPSSLQGHSFSLLPT